MDNRQVVRDHASFVPSDQSGSSYAFRLLFPRHDFVDGTWSTIAKSVANGPLKEAGVMLAKVAPTPSSPAAEVVRVLLTC